MIKEKMEQAEMIYIIPFLNFKFYSGKECWLLNRICIRAQAVITTQNGRRQFSFHFLRCITPFYVPKKCFNNLFVEVYRIIKPSKESDSNFNLLSLIECIPKILIHMKCSHQ